MFSKGFKEEDWSFINQSPITPKLKNPPYLQQTLMNHQPHLNYKKVNYLLELEDQARIKTAAHQSFFPQKFNKQRLLTRKILDNLSEYNREDWRCPNNIRISKRLKSLLITLKCPSVSVYFLDYRTTLILKTSFSNTKINSHLQTCKMMIARSLSTRN